MDDKGEQKMRGLWIGLTLFMSIALGYSEEELYVYNWAEYMPDTVIQKFQEETGIKVIYSTYDNNETMFAKMKILQGEGYDLVVPSTYYVQKMIKSGLIQAIDKSKLKNFKNLDPNLLDKPFDPDNQYSIPYLWGSTAIGVNSEVIPVESVMRYADLWKLEYAGRILMTDDLREVFGMALKILGYSCNETDPGRLNEAGAKLKELFPGVKAFNADSPKQPFLNKEVDIGLLWNGEAYMAAQENPAIRFVYPEEGVMLWVDSLVIPKSSKHVENAHKFIDFLLRPEIAVMISEEIGYASPNKAALNEMSEELRNNPTVYPGEAIIQKGEFQLDIGEAIIQYEKLWEELKGD